MSAPVIGVHLPGPGGDAAALAVVQRREQTIRADERDEQRAVEQALLLRAEPALLRRGVQRRVSCFDVVHLGQLASDSSVATVAGEILRLKRVAGLARADLVADGSAVGAPVVEELRARGLDPRHLLVTDSGPAGLGDDGIRRVPAADLAGLLLVLLEAGRLKIAAALPDAPVVVEQLRRVGARPGPLAVALLLAVWWAEQHGAYEPEDWPVLQF